MNLNYQNHASLGIVFPKIAQGDEKIERLLEFVSLYMILLALESRLVSNILLEHHCFITLDCNLLCNSAIMECCFSKICDL